MLTKAVVTGGAGFVGSNLVDRLVDDGAEVLVVDDLSNGKLERLVDARRNGHVQIHQMDVRADELTELLERYEPQTVFHLAAQVDVQQSVTDPIGDASANILGSINVFTAAVASGAERVVFTSSAARFGRAAATPTGERAVPEPLSPHGVAKLAAETYLTYFFETHGLEFVSLGLSEIYGPRQAPSGDAVVAKFANEVLAGRRPIVPGDGSERRDFVFVEDVSDACVRAAELGGNRYFNIGSGVATSLDEVLAVVQEAAGTRLDPVPSGEPLLGDLSRPCLDPTAAAAELEWQPWTSLEEGVGQTVEWFRRRH